MSQLDHLMTLIGGWCHITGPTVQPPPMETHEQLMLHFWGMHRKFGIGDEESCLEELSLHPNEELSLTERCANTPRAAAFACGLCQVTANFWSKSDAS